MLDKYEADKLKFADNELALFNLKKKYAEDTTALKKTEADKQKVIDAKNLGYNNVLIYDMLDLDKLNVFIYPNQTIYFEYYVSIDNSNNQYNQSSFVSIDYNSNKNYYATLSIASDSSNYKKILPNNILKTIEKNKIKVYHGIIESENKVPIKILD